MTFTAADDDLPEGWLSIGELAERTGLEPGTLRAWETRHGFPAPRRLASGHRRYDERDVARIRRVLSRRDAGVRLSTAIAEVSGAAPWHTPTESVFAELRRRHPLLVPQSLQKSTLLALTWAIEDECCTTPSRPTLFAAFQEERHYVRAQARWNELARTALRAVVFADFGAPLAAAPQGATQGAVRVHLPAGTPMRREWSLVCWSQERAAALAAWELPGQAGTPDRERIFEAMWTVDRPEVLDAARACASLAGRFAPDLLDGFPELDEAPRAPGIDDAADATALFNRVLTYLDRGRRAR
ncbi:MAG: DICT sensory domain-containing protein [Nocardioidaceae bacterium]